MVGSIFSTLISSFRAKFTSLWTKIRLVFSPTYWRTKGITKLRQFFSALFDVRPRDKKDYYSVGVWLISKRLAFALVVALAVGGIYILYIMAPSFGIKKGAEVAISTYNYNSIPLKFKSDVVKIRAKDKHIAYIGNVDKGEAVGSGKLYNKDNNLVYEGEFDNNMFNGQGKFYYPDGLVCYNGTFVDNIYSGTGSLYRKNGSIEYTGGFSNGKKFGEGELYDSSGNKVFWGNFQEDQLLYNEFLGKTTSQAAKMYTGVTGIYKNEKEYCVTMEDIGAVYKVKDGTNSLDSEWTINDIYVTDTALVLGNGVISTINGLTAYFGEPVYSGSTWVTLPEAVAINMDLSEKNNDDIGSVKIVSTEIFENVFDVERYDENYELYIYVYKMDGLLYTFYSENVGDNTFVMYSIGLE